MNTLKHLVKWKLIASLLLLPLVAKSEPLRTWTDNQGREVEASFVGFAGKDAKLALQDGQIISYPIARLSEADQDWLKAKWNFSPSTIAKQIDQFIMSGLQEAGRQPNPMTTDSQFVRRVYLELGGRIPTYDETTAFLESTDPNKRRQIIDAVLDSDDYVSHSFNWYADQLRVITHLRDYIIFEPYIEWIKESIREDMPWDRFIQRLIEAEGTVFDDPAAGWYIRDEGMALNNFSSMISTFLGTEITCAQCHDHPFEDWTQMDYYQLASFLRYRDDRRRFDGGFYQTFIPKRDQLEAEVRTLENEAEGFFHNDLRLMLAFNNLVITDSDKAMITLPGDYQYEDGEPGAEVEPLTIFGEDIKETDAETPRKAFSKWLTSKENPRFSVNMVNRIWDRAFGLPLQNPVDNLSNLNQAQNPELLTFLGESFKKLDFSLKELQRSIYYSEAWQREATRQGATEEEVGKNNYPFPGPLLKRMSAEQLWDSFLTLLIENPNDLQREVVDDFASVLVMDLETLKAEEVSERIEEASRLRRFVVYQHAPFANLPDPDERDIRRRENGDLLSQGNVFYVRASESRQPSRDDHFLTSWGRADREAPDNGSVRGSIPQVLHMLNGSLTHQLARPDSMIFKKAGGQRATGDKLDQIYLSILSRPAEGSEKALCYKAIRSSEEGYPDLIWALINTREFLFIQ